MTLQLQMYTREDPPPLANRRPRGRHQIRRHSLPFGRPTREPGNKWGFTYYQPKPIPRELPLDLSVVLELSTADAALGNLAGISALISDPTVLIGPYLRREAALYRQQLEPPHAFSSGMAMM